MAHDRAAPQRPERVVILDADDPMTEIHGEFVWLEEHQRAIAEARDAAYRDGYQDGQQAAPTPGGLEVRLRRRRTLGQQVRLFALILVALVIILMLPIVLT